MQTSQMPAAVSCTDSTALLKDTSSRAKLYYWDINIAGSASTSHQSTNAGDTDKKKKTIKNQNTVATLTQVFNTWLSLATQINTISQDFKRQRK